MTLGNLILPDGAWLAPMAGVTDASFRLLCHVQGAAFSFTEMVSAKGLLQGPARATAALLRREPGEGLVGVQLFGASPEAMGEAARRVEAMGFPLIDINMGCPAPKVTGTGAGSALLNDLPLAEAIIRAVCRAVHVPVTVKMRLGWRIGENVSVDLSKRAEGAGAAAVIVHGRVRQQMFSGKADWDAIAAVKAAVSIPVIGNGDVDNTDIPRGCDAVMIGRAALGNPWVFSGHPPTREERVAMTLAHAQLLIKDKGEPVAMNEMRKHAAWYVRGIPGAAILRGQLSQIRTLAELVGILKDLG